MDFSAKTIKNDVVRSERFRTPLNAEKKIGLWVDRIGHSKAVSEIGSKPRLLGLYGAVAIESGNGCFYSRSSGEMKLRQNDVIILFPDDPHLYGPDLEWETRWVVWHGPEASQLENLGFIAKGNSRINGGAGIVMLAYEKLHDLMNKEDLASILKRKNIILEMIHDLFIAAKTGLAAGQMADRMERVLEQMQDFENSSLSIVDLAAFCGLSETHFRRVFKSYTGRSPKDFLVSVRISKAKELLTRGHSIKDTAMQLGYRDIFYFMRQFKEVTGQTPGNF
jgi:AraC-like DNA-binding protein